MGTGGAHTPAATCLHAGVNEVPSPRELRGAAAVAQSLAYVAGLAGVVAGGLLFRQGDEAFAVVVWALTFAAGAILMIAAFLTRAVAALFGRIARIESDVAVLVADRDRSPVGGEGPDPWTGHPPHG